MTYQAFCETELKFCSKAQLSQDLLEIKEKEILLILSKSSIKRHDLFELNAKMASQNKVILFDSSYQNPTKNDINQVLKASKDMKPEIIIALGGGSVIDLAKGVKFYLNTLSIPLIAIPTTFGTGSELTQWATIWDKEKNIKTSLDESGLKPQKAYLIKEFSYTLPKKHLVITTLDALCQAMEAFWSVHSTPIVRHLSMMATKLIATNLPLAIKTKELSTGYRDKLCEASTLSALAFSQTRTTTCHAISYPLTLNYAIPHGLAVAITLDEVKKRNETINESIKNLSAIFASFDGLKSWLKEVCDGILSLNLSAYGVCEKDLTLLAKATNQSNRMANNPKNFSEEEILDILRICL